MAEALKHHYSNAYIRHVANCLAAEVSASSADISDYILSEPWDELELKQRMARLRSAFTQFLPANYNSSIEILKKLLPQISGDQFKYADMLAMCVPEFVVLRGMNDWETSLDALAYFTCNGTSSEFAIRPFIIADLNRAMQRMLLLADDENANVRRFASEGCRPRLPWAMALPELKKDPSLILPILEKLRQDDSLFVRKSVANNLNDIAKDHPGVVMAFAKKYLGTHKHTDWIIKHGCRTLLKQCNKEALVLFGSPEIKVAKPKLLLQQNVVEFGEALYFSFAAEILDELPANLRLEYAIDFMKANGKTSRKIFKLSERQPQDAAIEISNKHKFLNYTTRKHYAGRHQLAIIVNGDEVARQVFELNMV